MADGQISRPKRQGNYTPERIKVLEPEIGAKYGAGQSAKSLGREYGISKNTVLNIAERNGVPKRGKEEAGRLLRRTDCDVTPEEQADERSIAQQVAEKLGYGTSDGLSFDREFRTACAKERRRRKADQYRALDSKGKWFRNNIPKWQSRKQLDDFMAMARDLDLAPDHEIPLDHPLVCGLNVMSNMRLVSHEANWSKNNRFVCGPDPLIGPPRLELLSRGSNCGSTIQNEKRF